MSQLILASTSPRRKELLTFLGVDFKVVPSYFKEESIQIEEIEDKVEELARAKARSVAKLLDSDQERFLVLGGDTLIEDEEGMMGKVGSEQELREVLKRLSGKKHRVVTGIAVIDSWSKEERVASEESWVKFRDLTAKMIDKYVKLPVWKDKAGGYAVQDDPMGFVEDIEGNLSNIVGLPLGLTRGLLEEMGLVVPIEMEAKLLETMVWDKLMKKDNVMRN